METFDTSDRRRGAYILFALAFLGFMVGLAGVVIGSSLPAFLGALVLLLCMVAFRLRVSSREAA